MSAGPERPPETPVPGEIGHKEIEARGQELAESIKATRVWLYAMFAAIAVASAMPILAGVIKEGRQGRECAANIARIKEGGELGKTAVEEDDHMLALGEIIKLGQYLADGRSVCSEGSPREELQKAYSMALIPVEVSLELWIRNADAQLKRNNLGTEHNDELYQNVAH